LVVMGRENKKKKSQLPEKWEVWEAQERRKEGGGSFDNPTKKKAGTGVEGSKGVFCPLQVRKGGIAMDWQRLKKGGGNE